MSKIEIIVDPVSKIPCLDLHRSRLFICDKKYLYFILLREHLIYQNISVFNITGHMVNYYYKTIKKYNWYKP